MSDVIEVYDPGNGELLGTVPSASREDVELVLATDHRIADALNCGGVMINDSSDYRIDAMPFGGTRGSGLGKEGVAHAIHEMTDLKTYCFTL